MHRMMRLWVLVRSLSIATPVSGMTPKSDGAHIHPTAGVIKFLQGDMAPGLILAATVILAIGLFNYAPATPYYRDALQAPLSVGFADLELSKPLLLWINDGLMAVFFLLVGLELKRELLEGSLSSRDQIMLPALAAIGGMAAPALIYWLVNGGDPVLLRGWAIPAATDIAFALGALSLLGRRVPVSLKVFLLTLATLDDLGAIVVIALFYTAQISMTALTFAALAIVALLILNRLHYSSTGLYAIVGGLLWLCVLESGVHATLAGVVLGLSIPLRRRDGSPFLQAMEHSLVPYVKFLILPLFALANAGLPISDLVPSRAVEVLPLGIAAGLVLGKPLGVVGVCWIAVTLNLAKLPKDCDWVHLTGVGFLAGIGFTMSLFIGSLAFSSPEHLTAVRVGVLYGSVIATVVGLGVLMTAARLQQDTQR